MDEYLANKMCKLIASTTPYHIDEVKDVYERTKSIDDTVLILNMAVANYTSPYAILGAYDLIYGTKKEEEAKKQLDRLWEMKKERDEGKVEHEVKMCGDCKYFKQTSSHEGICSKGHGIVMQQTGGLPLGYRNYHDEVCSEALIKEKKK